MFKPNINISKGEVGLPKNLESNGIILKHRVLSKSHGRPGDRCLPSIPPFPESESNNMSHITKLGDSGVRFEDYCANFLRTW